MRVFSNKDKNTIKFMNTQIPIFSEVITESGGVSYRAEGTEHDDTVMGLMLACFIGRNFIKNHDGMFQPIQVASRKITEINEDVFGSGVPEYTEAGTREVYTP